MVRARRSPDACSLRLVRPFPPSIPNYHRTFFPSQTQRPALSLRPSVRVVRFYTRAAHHACAIRPIVSSIAPDRALTSSFHRPTFIASPFRLGTPSVNTAPCRSSRGSARQRAFASAGASPLSSFRPNAPTPAHILSRADLVSVRAHARVVFSAPRALRPSRSITRLMCGRVSVRAQRRPVALSARHRCAFLAYGA